MEKKESTLHIGAANHLLSEKGKGESGRPAAFNRCWFVNTKGHRPSRNRYSYQEDVYLLTLTKVIYYSQELPSPLRSRHTR
jgi:hypothetical protein